jgi:hypothetical protein
MKGWILFMDADYSAAISQFKLAAAFKFKDKSNENAYRSYIEALIIARRLK